jgi:predicted alpha/beta hydrolase
MAQRGIKTDDHPWATVGDGFGGVAFCVACDASRYHAGDTFVIDGGSTIFWRGLTFPAPRPRVSP